MAYDKVVDSSVLDAGLKAIADAIREKGGTSDNLAFPQAMAEAIAAIEAGGGGSNEIITGTFTCISETENVLLEGAIPVRSQVPKACWIYEWGVPYNDKTHTKRRLLAMLYVRKDGGTDTDTAGTYSGCVIAINSAGGNIPSATTISVTNLWNGTKQRIDYTTSNLYDAFKGDYAKGTLFFGCIGNYGLTAGRTYCWGVIPWDE